MYYYLTIQFCLLCGLHMEELKEKKCFKNHNYYILYQNHSRLLVFKIIDEDGFSNEIKLNTENK